jgi:hypothetical protein
VARLDIEFARFLLELPDADPVNYLDKIHRLAPRHHEHG